MKAVVCKQEVISKKGSSLVDFFRRLVFKRLHQFFLRTDKHLGKVRGVGCLSDQFIHRILDAESLIKFTRYSVERTVGCFVF